MRCTTGMDRLDTPAAYVPQAVQLRTPDAGRALGALHVRFRDLDDHVTFTSHQLLVAGGRLGAVDGYATLRDAMRELAALTTGDQSAGVVLEREGRFYGHVLKGRDMEQGLSAPAQRLHLEADDRAEVVRLRTSDRNERVRALVDGAWAHRFRST